MEQNTKLEINLFLDALSRKSSVSSLQRIFDSRPEGFRQFVEQRVDDYVAGQPDDNRMVAAAAFLKTRLEGQIIKKSDFATERGIGVYHFNQAVNNLKLEVAEQVQKDIDSGKISPPEV